MMSSMKKKSKGNNFKGEKLCFVPTVESNWKKAQNSVQAAAHQ